jgi:hypothetical protein
MTTRVAEVSRAAAAMFSGGWSFFLPYVALYLAAIAVDARNGALRASFVVVHMVLLAALVGTGVAAVRRSPPRPRALLRNPDVWFWSALVLLFVLPGAYLEFPSDAWEHLWRLNHFDLDGPVRQNATVAKFAYFWGWSLLSFVPPQHQRLALDVYSAFWQTLLAVQLYRLARAFELPRGWSRLAVFGAVALFGNNLFSFFRYYALSSTPLAYVAYLRALIALVEVRAGRRPRVPLLVLTAALVLMLLNHLQEVELLALAGATLGALRLYRRLSAPARARTIAVSLVAWLASFPLAQILMEDPPAFGLKPALGGSWLSLYGIFRVWDPELSFLPTIGLGGLIALAAAVLLRLSSPAIAALTLAPVGLLLCPPFAILLAQSLPDVSLSYRVLFVVPSSLMLAAAFRDLGARGLVGRSDAAAQGWLAAVLATMGLTWAPPVFGKLAFQIHRPAPYLSLAYLDPTARWFHENRPPRQCVVKSDSVSEYGLAALRGTPLLVDRLLGRHAMGRDWQQLWRPRPREISGTPEICGILVADAALFREAVPDRPESWVQGATLHWPAGRLDPVAATPPGLRDAGRTLRTLGWRKTFVPPFYWYYERTGSKPGR